METQSIYAALLDIQSKINVPKNQGGKDIKYKYRSLETILEKLKPLLISNKVFLVLADEVISVGGQNYVKATARITNGVDSIESTAIAREDMQAKFMSAPQMTGSCSSYARKNALCGLLLLDDNKDVDSNDFQNGYQRAQAKAGDLKISQAKTQIPAELKLQKAKKDAFELLLAEGLEKEKMKDIFSFAGVDLANFADVEKFNSGGFGSIKEVVERFNKHLKGELI